MPRTLRNVLVTGGCGFIGSAFIRYLFSPDSAFTGRVVNLDAMTYASSTDNVADIASTYQGCRYFFVKADVCDREEVLRVMRYYEIDTVVHFAAESHVDRSISSSDVFMKTNVMGTYNLLECAREAWSDISMNNNVIFHYVGTDEVYGDKTISPASEDTLLSPSNPYAASKASGDHLCSSWHRTYGLPVTLTRASNNYGPRQYAEKFLPLMIEHIRSRLPLPVYGDGRNKRDWLHVFDHVRAIWLVIQHGNLGGIYNVAGGNEWRNIDLLNHLIGMESTLLNINAEAVRRTIRFVPDRLGHDTHYSMDSTKITTELGWKPIIPFEQGLENTVKWFLHIAPPIRL